MQPSSACYVPGTKTVAVIMNQATLHSSSHKTFTSVMFYIEKSRSYLLLVFFVEKFD